MGRRHESLRFLPGFLVFPGGRVEAQDRKAKAIAHLDKACLATLIDESREPAEALARAAVRECIEETGLMIVPHLAKPLRYMARAITPPGLAIRYDTRFFLADVSARDSPPQPQIPGDGELLSPAWYDVGALHTEKLHHVTQAVLQHVLRAYQLSGSSFGRLLIADKAPQRWRGLPPLRSRGLKASIQSN